MIVKENIRENNNVIFSSFIRSLMWALKSLPLLSNGLFIIVFETNKIFDIWKLDSLSFSTWHKNMVITVLPFPYIFFVLHF